jgi:hypothetical protein
VEEDMTEFLGTDGSHIADEVTGLTTAAEEVVAARPELVWDLIADITRVGGWSPECIRAAWLADPARPRRGGTGSTRSPAAAAGSGSASPTDPAPATCGQPPRRRRTGPLRSSLPGGTGCGPT